MDNKNSKNVVKKNTLQRTLRINQWTAINLAFLEHWTKCNLKLLSQSNFLIVSLKNNN